MSEAKKDGMCLLVGGSSSRSGTFDDDNGGKEQ